MSKENDERWQQPAEGRYANYFKAGFNSEEVVLDLGQLYGMDGSAVFHTRIVTSPAYAGALAELLSKTLSAYKASHGPFNLDEVRESIEDPGAREENEGIEFESLPLRVFRETVVATAPVPALGRRAPVSAPSLSPEVALMVGPAVIALLQQLQGFLPPPTTPPSGVSLVSVEEQSVGLGRLRGLGTQDDVPVVLKGVRVHGVVRFDLWDSLPNGVESTAATLIDQILGQSIQLAKAGFLEIKLKTVSLAEQVEAVSAWRVSAEFEVTFEFDFQDTDGAGGLIARIPAEFRETFGAATITGDLVVWNDEGAATLRLNGGKTVDGLSTLSFLPGGLPADGVTILRTFQGAFGAPVPFTDLDDFLVAVGGSTPAQRHASIQFSSLSDFLTAIGPESDPVDFLDELDVPRAFRPRVRAFNPPVRLDTKTDRFEVTFSGPALAASQILYLRASRGPTNPS